MNHPVFREGNKIKLNFDGRAIEIECTVEEIFPARIIESYSPGSNPSGGSIPGSGTSGWSGVLDTDRPCYSWTEIEPTVNGLDYVDKLDGRIGTATECPAFEMNDSPVLPGTRVWMRKMGFATGGTLNDGNEINSSVYEFSVPYQPSTSLTVITGITWDSATCSISYTTNTITVPGMVVS